MRSTALALVSLAVFLASMPAARAQDVPRPAPPAYVPPPDADDGGETVMGSHLESGGYGAPSLKLTSLAGDGIMMAGAEGGWIIGHSFVLGAAGYGSVSEVVSPTSLQPTIGSAHMSLDYGGFKMAGIIRPHRLTHLTLGVLLGGGASRSATRDGTYRTSDDFFVVEPELGTETNLSRHVRLSLSGGFRFVGGTEVSGFTATRLGGPSGTVSLRFGEF